MGIALPVLLITLAIVGIVVAVGYGIAHVIKGSVTKVNLR